jgi:hypothetical protein
VKLWDTLKKHWHKWTGSPTYRGPSLSEDQIVDKVADEVGSAIEKQGNAVVRQIVIEANKAKVPPAALPYTFWLITSARKHWPEMSKLKGAGLSFARDIMAETGVTPLYRDAMALPPAEQEGAIDQAVNKVAFWAASSLALEIHKVYRKALVKWERPMQKATEGQLPPDKALPYLKRLFEAHVERNPARFVTGDLIDQWLFSLIKR